MSTTQQPRKEEYIFHLLGLYNWGGCTVQQQVPTNLIITNASINDIGMRNLDAGLSSNASLRKLDLSCNTSITAAGLSHFKQCFESSTCSLQVLGIYSMNIGDKGALALVDALAHSKSLKELGIRWHSSGVSVGLQAFSKLLCVTSAPNNAYLSNHTLRSIGDPRSWNAVADQSINQSWLGLAWGEQDLAAVRILEPKSKCYAAFC